MPKKNAPKTAVRIASLDFSLMTKAETYRKILAFLDSKAECAKIYTPNPQMVLGVSRDPSLAPLFARADLLLPDGIGVILASRWLGTPLPERITGIDTAEYVLQIAEKKGRSIALLGGKKGVAKRAAMHLKKRYPALSVVFTHHGYFEKEGAENERVLRGLRSAAPDILFVCFGFPLQETWIDRYASSIPSLRLCMGLGGALDVWAGDVHRAPKWVSTCGMEWLWRTLGDPRRYRNFSELPAFLALIARTRLKGALKGRA